MRNMRHIMKIHNFYELISVLSYLAHEISLICNCSRWMVPIRCKEELLPYMYCIQIKNPSLEERKTCRAWRLNRKIIVASTNQKMGVIISKELLEMFLRNKGNTFLVTNMEVQNNFVLSLFEVIVIVQTSL